MPLSFRLLAACAALALAGAAFSATPSDKTLTPQQQRMSDCNHQATGMKGDEHKAFMSSCLKKPGAGSINQTQQDKMKSCNADASSKALKGDARKSYMSTCLKGHAK